MARDDYKWNTNSRDEKQSNHAESGYATSSFERRKPVTRSAAQSEVNAPAWARCLPSSESSSR